MVDRTSKEKVAASSSTNKVPSESHPAGNLKADSQNSKRIPGKVSENKSPEEHKSVPEVPHDQRFPLEKKLTKSAKRKLNRKQKQQKNKDIPESNIEVHKSPSNSTEIPVSSTSVVAANEFSEEISKESFRESAGTVSETSVVVSQDLGVDIEGSEISHEGTQEVVHEKVDEFQRGHPVSESSEVREERKGEIETGIVVESMENEKGLAESKRDIEIDIGVEGEKQGEDSGKGIDLVSEVNTDLSGKDTGEVGIVNAEIRENEEQDLDSRLAKELLENNKIESEIHQEEEKEVKSIDVNLLNEKGEDEEEKEKASEMLASVEEPAENNSRERSIIPEGSVETKEEDHDILAGESCTKTKEEDKTIEESVSEMKIETKEQSVYDQKDDEIVIESYPSVIDKLSEEIEGTGNKYGEDLNAEERETHSEIRIEPRIHDNEIYSEESKAIDAIPEEIKETIADLLDAHVLKEDNTIASEERISLEENPKDSQITQETKDKFDECSSINNTPEVISGNILVEAEAGIDTINIEHQEKSSDIVAGEDFKEIEGSTNEIEINHEEKNEVSEKTHDNKVEVIVADIEAPEKESYEHPKGFTILHEDEKSEQDDPALRQQKEHHQISHIVEITEEPQQIIEKVIAPEETSTKFQLETTERPSEESKQETFEPKSEVPNPQSTTPKIFPSDLQISLPVVSKTPHEPPKIAPAIVFTQLTPRELPNPSNHLFDLSSPILSSTTPNPNRDFSEILSKEPLEESKEIPFGDISGIGISEEPPRRKFGTKIPRKSHEPSSPHKPHSIIKDPIDTYPSSDEETKKEIEAIQSALGLSDAADIKSKHNHEELQSESLFENSRNSMFDKDNSRENIMVPNQFTEITSGASEKDSELDQAIVVENSGYEERVDSGSSDFEDTNLLKRAASQNYECAGEDEYQEMEIFEGTEVKAKHRTISGNTLLLSLETGMLIVNKLEPSGGEVSGGRETEEQKKELIGVNAVSVENSSNSSVVDEEKRIKIIDCIDGGVKKTEDIKVEVSGSAEEEDKEVKIVEGTADKEEYPVTYNSETIEVTKTREEYVQAEEENKEDEVENKEKKENTDGVNKSIDKEANPTAEQSIDRSEEEKVHPGSKKIDEETKITPQGTSDKQDKLTDTAIIPSGYQNSLACLTKEEMLKKRPQKSGRTDTSCGKCLVF